MAWVNGILVGAAARDLVVDDAWSTAAAGSSGRPAPASRRCSGRVCIAAAAVTSLNVEPGGSVVWMARLSSGCDGIFDS